VPRTRSPARLIVALSVAGALAVFLIYTAIAGGGTPSLQPSNLAGHHGQVSLAGAVVGPVHGDSYSAGGKHFRLRDVNGTATVPVVYHGQVPDQFKVGRHVVLDGRLRHGIFVGKRDSLVTKCPSKYAPAKSKS
jgi:cytochrome c-type biogenesis protein CcmE